MLLCSGSELIAVRDCLFKGYYLVSLRIIINPLEKIVSRQGVSRGAVCRLLNITHTLIGPLPEPSGLIMI